jgi:PAS domain S-box-containing protein
MDPARRGFESTGRAPKSLVCGTSMHGTTRMKGSAGAGPKVASPLADSASRKGGPSPRKGSGASIVIWAVIAGLGILFGVFAVAIGYQAVTRPSTFGIMTLILSIAIETPLAGGTIALVWYSRVLKRATAAREAATEALVQSEAKYRELIASAPDGIFVLEADAKVLDVNEAGESLLGRSRAEILGHSFMEFVPPERLPYARAYLADRLQGKRAAELYDAIFAAAGGKQVQVQLRSQVVRPADTDPYVVYIVRDVTAQREAQRKLVETERWASMGRLASFVAHEINTPLTNISLLTASISRRVSDPEVQERLKKISAQGKIAASITGELLKFARPGAINPVDTDLVEVLREAIEQTDAFRKSGVELVDEVGARSIRCTIDPLRIQEVFVNLLKNAYEATPSGRVRIRLEDLGSLVAVSISDTGSGMTPEVQARLFEAFFTTKKKGEGTGLGLAISRNFVASHGGDISVTSEPGRGSTITVVLPKQTPESERAA